MVFEAGLQDPVQAAGALPAMHLVYQVYQEVPQARSIETSLISHVSQFHPILIVDQQFSNVFQCFPTWHNMATFDLFEHQISGFFRGMTW